eukprot:COSAG01_NODE_9165_length_2531_cov_969.355674_1_plen_66_part_00
MVVHVLISDEGKLLGLLVARYSYMRLRVCVSTFWGFPFFASSISVWSNGSMNVLRDVAEYCTSLI